MFYFAVVSSLYTALPTLTNFLFFCRLSEIVPFLTCLCFVTPSIISCFVNGLFFLSKSSITSATVPFLYPHSFNAYMPLPTNTNWSYRISSLCTACVVTTFLSNPASAILFAISMKCNDFP